MWHLFSRPTLNPEPPRSSFSLENKFFFRVVQYNYLNAREIFVITQHIPRVLTLEGWPMQVFLQADGQKRVAHYLEHLRQAHPHTTPSQLRHHVARALLYLADTQLISFSPTAETLPYYLRFPQSELDIKKAAVLMKEDGYLTYFR